jgi:GNAT superfamily N-acetyltransferase
MASSNRFCHFVGWSARESVTSGEDPPPANREPSDRWTARPAEPEDFGAWEALFAGYCEFYERPSTPEHRRLVWSWIEAGTIHCRLAVPAGDGGADAVGLAHLRPVPSPLRGAATGYLDDLFVSPTARGTGAFDCLIAAIRELAAAEGWANVRWITAADNLRAQAAYDRVSKRTDWVTYQLDL